MIADVTPCNPRDSEVTQVKLYIYSCITLAGIDVGANLFFNIYKEDTRSCFRGIRTKLSREKHIFTEQTT